jgi:tRNA (cmo5U34)-methyltransferase
MDKVKKHFQNDAETFDKRVIKSVPFYDDMLEALVSTMPFRKNARIKVVDLGCGTGSISKKIKEHYPNAGITCVDFADNMLRIAKDKLSCYKNIEYVVCDVIDFDYSGYDAVLSSLTLHHIRIEKAKNILYKKIFNGLRRNGVFYLADLVLGSSDYLQNLNLMKWQDFLQKSLSKREITNRKRRYHKEDCPSKLMDEILRLQQSGFRNVDVVWKYYHFAVYGGEKR